MATVSFVVYLISVSCFIFSSTGLPITTTVKPTVNGTFTNVQNMSNNITTPMVVTENKEEDFTDITSLFKELLNATVGVITNTTDLLLRVTDIQNVTSKTLDVTTEEISVLIDVMNTTTSSMNTTAYHDITKTENASSHQNNSGETNLRASFRNTTSNSTTATSRISTSTTTTTTTTTLASNTSTIATTTTMNSSSITTTNSSSTSLLINNRYTVITGPVFSVLVTFFYGLVE